jgi:phosphopentomutase
LHKGTAEDLGTRQTFADIAATLSAYFQLPNGWPVGDSFVPKNEPIELGNSLPRNA